MKLLPFLLVLLLACRSPRTDREDAAAPRTPTTTLPRADGGGDDADARSRPPPPPGERVARVTGIVPHEYQLPPPAVVGHPPSAAHPLGTVFVAGMHGASEEDEITPYVAEWDLQHETVVHRWANPRAGQLQTVPDLAFDGMNLFVFTRWNENPDRNGERRMTCRIDVLDGSLKTTRSRRAPCGGTLTEARGGGVLLRTFGAGSPDAEAVTLQLLDASLRIRVTTTWLVPERPTYAVHPLVHAGDSFYLLVAANDATLRIVRLDDRTLRERARSPSLGAVDGPSTFSKADDGWVVSRMGSYWRVSALLERAELRKDEEDLGDAEAWHGRHRLSRAGVPEGSSVDFACAPLWVLETPLFVCAIDSEIAVVRPALEDVRLMPD